MGLFDILANPILQQAVGALAGQAQESLKNFGQSAPKGMGGMGGMVGAGALGALLGTLLPKSAGGAAGLLGLGAIALNFYQKWASERGTTAQPLFGDAEALRDEFKDTKNNPAALLLLRAIIFAARADGHIDAQEQERIEVLVGQFFPGTDVKVQAQALMQEPLDPASIAKDIRSPEQAEDLFRLSCVVIDIDHFMEESYLGALATHLGLSQERASALIAEANGIKQQLGIS